MSSQQDEMMAAQQAAGQVAVDPAGAVDPAAFTPEQWQAYQHAYAQAMQAQQLYAQAQQVYAQAEQTGQVEAAQHAYAQAMQAQQMYTQAHAAYLAILQQVQGQSGAAPQHIAQPTHEHHSQQALPQAAPQAPMQGYADPHSQQALAAASPEYVQQQQAAYAQQQQQAAYAQQQQMAQQAAYAQQQQAAYAQQQQAAYAQQQQAAYAQQQQAAAYAQQQTGYAQQQGYMQEAQVQQPPVGDPFAQQGGADWDEVYYDDSMPEQQKGGGLWIWIIGFLFIVGSFVGLHLATQPPVHDPFKNPEPRERITKEQREARRRAMLGLDKEKPSKYLRAMELSTKGSWDSMAVAGKGECRSVYFANSSGVYVAESRAPKDEKDYLQKIHPDDPFRLKKLPLPPRTFSRQLITTPAGSYLLVRAQIARQSWMLLYPLLGNPLKGKGRKRGADCGQSGRQPADYLLKRNLVLLGEGSCSLANTTLGVKPRLCLSGITVPSRAQLWFWQQGRRFAPPKGRLLLGTNIVQLKRRARPKSGESLFGVLRRSVLPTMDMQKRRWVSLEKGKRGLWTYTGRDILPLDIKIPVITKGAIRILLDKSFLRIVYTNRILKFKRDPMGLKRVGIYPFGDNVKAKYASWDSSGNILLLFTEKKTVYQFSEKP